MKSQNHRLLSGYYIAQNKHIWSRLRCSQMYTWAGLGRGYSGPAREGSTPSAMTIDPTSCFRLLRSCDGLRSLSQGKQLHLLLLKSGLASSLFISNTLLQMYTRCSGGDTNDARHLFDEMPQRNCYSWNSLIDAYLKSNKPAAAMELFSSMPERDAFTWNATVTGLARRGDLDTAQRLFEEMPEKQAVSLNAVIHGLIRHSRLTEAFRLYKKFGSTCTDCFVLATLASACADQRVPVIGRQVHARIVVGQVELDSVLGSALVDMYAKCEDLDNACKVFELMPEQDEFSSSALIFGYANCGRLMDARRIFDSRDKHSVVLWNSIINGYALNDQAEEAFLLFKTMKSDGVEADSSTFASILTACVSSGMASNGKQMHACALKLGIVEDIIAASALLDSYSKSAMWEDACKVFSELKVQDTVSLNSMVSVYCNCDRIQDARAVFDSIPSKSSISWNSMIVGYSQNGCALEALELFKKMHELDVRLDRVAVASAVSACASISAIRLGEQIFALATVTGQESDQIISTSQVDLYCKCGNVSDGRRIFNGMTKSDAAPWNSMLMGYASNGHGHEVLELFADMKQAGVVPNQVTFIGVLSGCCHCGMVEEGLKWFHDMKTVYRIEPILEHYSCIVDLLVRAGRLEEAVGFMDSMPFKADASILTSVLGGCKAQGDESLGCRVAERIVKLDPQQSGPFAQLAGLYASYGEWEMSARVREMMRERRVHKNPGYSWTG